MAGGALARAQKGALAEGRTIVWVDEAGCYLLPALARTSAPVGRTPVLYEQVSRDHLSVISGITLEGRLDTMAQDRALTGADVVRSLKHLLRRIPGTLLVIWDGAPIHKNRAVQGFLAGGAAARLRLGRLPGYAPELNLDEGGWRYLTRAELRNVCCQDPDELRRELRQARERLRRKPHLLRSCVKQPGYV